MPTPKEYGQWQPWESMVYYTIYIYIFLPVGKYTIDGQTVGI